MVTSKYFKEEEFKKASPACSLQDMKQDFMTLLDKTREMAKIPFIVNSAFRTVTHEKKMGRDGKSAHTQGRAADIKAIDGRSKFLIVETALKVGFTRIGVHKNFIHLDNSSDLPQKVVWLY
jgi:uncharacterized protein YcbK (DUF882 family)